jgi:hypothetical protein
VDEDYFYEVMPDFAKVFWLSLVFLKLEVSADTFLTTNAFRTSSSASLDSKDVLWELLGNIANPFHCRGRFGTDHNYCCASYIATIHRNLQGALTLTRPSKLPASFASAMRLTFLS